MRDSAQKIAILGASRGLGRALCLHIQTQGPASELFVASRKEMALREIRRGQDSLLVADFTKADDQARLQSALFEFRPNSIFYVAGGGPFGDFEKKEWKDHQWAFDLNFAFPAKLLHTMLADPSWSEFLRQFVWIGSAIAGEKPDPQAASYAAAKHAARGLVSSLQKEAAKKFDIALYEPGYMATEMLPPHAWPRQQGLAKSAEDEARELWQWSQTRIK
jgi:short-subunit dehydrogenase